MSQKNVKGMRRLIRKNKKKIIKEFLEAVKGWNIAERMNLALKILFKR